MRRAEVNAFCATLPATRSDDPWGGGHDCWKIAEKMFANVGAKDVGVTFKCPNADVAAMLMDANRVERAPYMPRGAWVLARWDAMEPDELRERLLTSYLIVRRGLPKRVQKTLPPEPPA